MEHPQFLKCLENISTLTHEQLSLLSAALNDRSHPGAPKPAVMSRIEHNFSSHPACPHCHSESISAGVIRTVVSVIVVVNVAEPLMLLLAQP